MTPALSREERDAIRVWLDQTIKIAGPSLHLTREETAWLLDHTIALLDALDEAECDLELMHDACQVMGVEAETAHAYSDVDAQTAAAMATRAFRAEADLAAPGLTLATETAHAALCDAYEAGRTDAPGVPVTGVSAVNALLGVNLWDVRSFRADVRIDFHEDGSILAATLLNPGATVTNGADDE